MKKLIKVVMLPTKEASTIYKYTNGISLGKHSLHIGDFVKCEENDHIRTNQHLYIIVSQDVEPIGEGDWFITMQNHIFKCVRITATSVYFNQHNDGHEYIAQIERCRKIIATTDPKLTVIDFNRATGSKFQNIPFKPIPQVQQSFIKEFVANPDGEFEVEYEWVEGIGERLLIQQDTNTVNITPVEEKMYSKDEIENILFQYAEEEHAWFSCKSEIESFNNWIKENL